MDADEYRTSYEAEARRAKPPKETGTRELTAIIRDPKRRPKARIEAIDEASAGAVETPSVMTLLIKILGDAGEDDSVRQAALAALLQNSFSATEFRRYAADFNEALRTAATDESEALRDQAMDTLALNGDEYVQRLLVEGLQDPKAALVKPQRAIQMIGYDAHAEHYDVLRDLVETSKQKGVRRSALNVLAADSGAKDLFVRIATDKDEDPAARSTSAIALQSIAPDDFSAAARDVVLDDDDDDAVRATFVTAMAHSTDAVDDEVGEKVRSLSESDAPSKQLKGAVTQYLRAADGEP